MSGLTTEQLGQACRLFMDLAYPGGPNSVPSKKRPYHNIPADASLDHYLPPASLATGVAEPRKGGQPGFDFRLGSAHFPHLKLRVHQVDFRGSPLWIYAVDTHDAFSRNKYSPPDDHPDAVAWRALQEQNAQLKAQIEEAFENAGFVTFKMLLRMGLPASATA